MYTIDLAPYKRAPITIPNRFHTLSRRATSALSRLVQISREKQITQAGLTRIPGLDDNRKRLLSQLLFESPIVQEYDGILVVRDDLIPGGTKSRYFIHLFAKHDEIVYASTTWGGAQIALAHSARLMNKRATLFVAKRNELHPRTIEAQNIGKDHVKVIQVPHGYLIVLQANARRYCERNPNSYYLEVGGKEPLVMELLSKTANQVEEEKLRLINNQYSSAPAEKVLLFAHKGH